MPVPCARTDRDLFFRTTSSDKVGPDALLAPMPALIGNDDSERGLDFDNMSEGLSHPSFDAAIDRVVTPFHPEIPMVRTRVLEELAERIPFPYPSEPISRRPDNLYGYVDHLVLRREPAKVHSASYHCATKPARNRTTADLYHLQHGMGLRHDDFDPNNEKMVFREDIGEFDTLLGHFEGRRFHRSASEEEEELDFGLEEKVRRSAPRSSSTPPTTELLHEFSEAKKLAKRPRSKSSPQASQEERRYQEAIGEFDVLLGRGPQIYQHEGNQRFHELKMDLQPRYLEAPKDGKIAISQSLVDAIHDIEGRFLRYDDSQAKWYEVSNRVAREKAAQALRETFTKEDRQKKRLKYKKKGSSGGAV